MPTIYRKTTKGQTEIETRAHRLAPRLRSLLILVDGRRSDADLERLMPQVSAAALVSLADGGFIEVISVTTVEPRPAAAATAATPPAAAAPTPAPTPAPAPSSAAAPLAPPVPSAAPAPPPTVQAPIPAWPSRTDIFDGREPPTLPLPIPAPATTSHPIPFDDRPVAPWLVHQRDEAVHALRDICGGIAEPLAVRMGQARTNEELSQLLDLAIQLVANTRGRQQAVDYGTRFKGG